MRFSWLTATGVLCAGGAASAGGLFLPGAGSVSTARAGASVVAADDGEALSLNPAGLSRTEGTVITFGIAAIDYNVDFTRSGNYPAIMEESTTYAGKPFPKMSNNAKPPLGLGSFQPVPVIAVTSDLGKAIPHLKVGFGIYAPNAYPFRDFTTVNGRPWVFNNNVEDPPPPTRYDMMHEEAAIILPTLGVAYSPIPQLDLGARFSAGIATLKSTVALWAMPGNYEEWQQQDGVFTLNASGFVATGAFGAIYHFNEEWEAGVNYNLPMEIHAKGDASSDNGPAVNLGGAAVYVTPVADSAALCSPGGKDNHHLKGCVDLMLPMNAQAGVRHKFLDDKGKLKGDVEVDLGWENWGKSCDYTMDPKCLDPSDFHVTVDAQAGKTPMPTGGEIALKESFISHGYQDTFDLRVGGSYVVPLDEATSIVTRGGISYDTAAAKTGWERLDVDGAARTMFAAGATYQRPRIGFDLGFGYIYEGSRTQDRNCVTTGTMGNQGCGPGGTSEGVPGFGPGPFRAGPDPLNPLVVASQQFEHPVNEGKFNSSYIFIMLGMKAKF